MSTQYEIDFAASAALEGSVAVMLQVAGQDMPAGTTHADPESVSRRAAGIAKFSAKSMSTVDVLAPHGAPADRLVVLGLGTPEALTAHYWLRAGGAAAAAAKAAKRIIIYLDAPGLTVSPEQAADFALGMLLRGYSFDAYKTRKKDDEEKQPKKVDVIVVTECHKDARKAFGNVEAIAGGVLLARDLVNLPPNALGPVEVAERARALGKLGLEVEILTEKEMRELKMGALLGVAQGSARPPRLAVMQWRGGKPKDAPVAFVGKGVVFD